MVFEMEEKDSQAKEKTVTMKPNHMRELEKKWLGKYGPGD